MDADRTWHDDIEAPPVAAPVAVPTLPMLTRSEAKAMQEGGE
jgi:hypothetical protein